MNIINTVRALSKVDAVFGVAMFVLVSLALLANIEDLYAFIFAALLFPFAALLTLLLAGRKSDKVWGFIGARWFHIRPRPEDEIERQARKENVIKSVTPLWGAVFWLLYVLVPSLVVRNLSIFFVVLFVLVARGVVGLLLGRPQRDSFDAETASLSEWEQSVRRVIPETLVDYYSPSSEFPTVLKQRSAFKSDEDYNIAKRNAAEKTLADRITNARRYLLTDSIAETDSYIEVCLMVKEGSTDDVLVKKADIINAALNGFGVDEYDYDKRAGFVGFRIATQPKVDEMKTLIELKYDKQFFMKNPCHDPFDLPVAVDANGRVFYLPTHHTLIAGVTGSGKSSPLQAIIRLLAPYVKARTVRFWGMDPKRAEFKPYINTSLFHRLAFDSDSMAELVHEIYADLKEAQLHSGRSSTLSTETPMNVLFADEFVALMNDKAFMGHKGSDDVPVSKKLYDIMAQGRSDNFFLIAATQEVVASVLGQFRTNFANRIALRLNTSSHVDIVLGEGSVSNGAVAHEIPSANRKNNYMSAGIGNVKEEDGSLALVRFAYSSDEDIDELVAEFALGSGPTTPDTSLSSQAEVSDEEVDAWIDAMGETVEDEHDVSDEELEAFMNLHKK